MSTTQALLVIDVQTLMFDESAPVFNGAGLLETLQSLIAKAREAGVPVVYVQHNEEEGLEPGTHAWTVHEAIAPIDGDIVVQKWTPDSFFETNLHDELNRRGIQELVLTGIQTDVCVDTTCRRAYTLGYKSTLVSDAHSTWPRGELSAAQIIAHHNAVLQWFAKTMKSEEIEFTALPV